MSSGDSEFNADRLQLARRRRALTKVSLAGKVGLTARRIAAIENEGEVPSALTVEKFAEALQFPEGFFYRAAPPQLSREAVSFRSFSRLPAGQRDAALAASALAIEAGEWMDTQFDLPAVSLPDLRGVDPGTAALVIRGEWGLGADPAPNLIHLLEARGVRVFSLVDDCAALDAFSLWYEGKPFVFLTRHKSPERGRWDAAHELAHLVLHQGSPPQGREYEREADAFASECLLPELGVRATSPRFPSLVDVRREKMKWQVSTIAYVRRLHDLGIIPERRYRSLAIEASQAGYRRAEGEIAPETSQLVPKVLAMLREDGIVPAHVAATLQIEPSELRGLLFSPLSPVEGGSESRKRASTRHLRAV